MADEQPTDDRDAEWAAQFGALAETDRQRHRAEHRRHRRHDDRTEPFEARLIDCLARGQACAALGVERKIDHHDRIFLDDADQQDQADQRDQAEFGVGRDQRQHRTDPRGGQGREDRDRVDIAFVEDSEHDVDGKQRGTDQKGLVGERCLKGLGRPLESAVDRGRHAKSGHLIVDRRRRFAEREARSEIERYRRGGEQILVIDRMRRGAGAEMAERGKRHHGFERGADRGAGRRGAVAGIGERIVCGVADRVARNRRRGCGTALNGRRLAHHRAGERLRSLRAADRAAAGADIDLMQDLWRLPELGRHLHYDMVLITGLVDYRYLALPKGIIQRVVDLTDGQPEACRAGAIDDQIRLERPLLLVELDIGQQRQPFQRSLDLGRPVVEFAVVFAMQRVLILGVAGAAADADILNRSEICRGAPDLVELRLQPARDLLGRYLALGQRLQDDKGVGVTAAAVEAVDMGDRRIIPDDIDELGQLLFHQLKRDALVGLYAAPHQPAVLLRHETLWHVDEEVDGDPHRRQQAQHDEGRPLQCPAQRAVVKVQYRVKGPLASAVQPAVLVVTPLRKQVGAHHRCRRQRDDQRYHDRRR